jgi:uncharacterized membrane protein
MQSPLQQPQQQQSKAFPPKWAAVVLIILALIGFCDATYLTIDHYQNIAPPCFVGSCEVVLTSAYSTVAGIPVSIFGVAYYLFIVVALFAFINSSADPVTGNKKTGAFRAALYVTPLGFLASLYFFIIQAFVLDHFCQYCLLSATTSTVLFLIASYLLLKMRKLSRVPR